MDPRGEPVDPAPRWTPTRSSEWLILLGIVVVAFTVRAVPVLRGAGLQGNLGYDDGVYYAAAAALVRGVLPYRDFLLLHPPGITVLLSPFALLGAATDDSTGFAVARVAFMALGAINTLLVALVAGRYGRRAALFSAALYAVWYSATRVERTVSLLDPETTLLLIGVLLVSPRGALGFRRAALGGAALGLAVGIQLWQALPLLIVVGAVALQSRRSQDGWRRPTVGMLTGAAVAFLALCLPFALAAPGTFVRYVLFDQLGRPDIGVSLFTRLAYLEALPTSSDHFEAILQAGVYGLAAVGIVAVVFVAWRVPDARMWCAIVVAEAGYLILGPLIYPHYSGWIAPAGAIVLGTGAAAAVTALDPHRPFGTLARAGFVLVIAGLAITSLLRRPGAALPRADLERDTAGARCVAADSPILLIETTALRRSLQAGCQLVIDPTGVSYDTDRGRLQPGPVGASRRGAPGYQQAMTAYYSGADAAMFTRIGADSLTPATASAIAERLPVLVTRGQVTERLRTGISP